VLTVGWISLFYVVGEGEPLYFADVCAGPGGFSEYVLWKKKWRCKGFGFTIKAAGHDFRYTGPRYALLLEIRSLAYTVVRGGGGGGI
jgi:hypothetical protein